MLSCRNNLIIFCEQDIMLSERDILSCSGEILSYRNNFIVLFEQDNKLYKRDLKSFEQHIIAADNSTLRRT